MQVPKMGQQLARLRGLRGRLPGDFRFGRDDANAR